MLNTTDISYYFFFNLIIFLHIYSYTYIVHTSERFCEKLKTIKSVNVPFNNMYSKIYPITVRTKEYWCFLEFMFGIWN